MSSTCVHLSQPNSAATVRTYSIADHRMPRLYATVQQHTGHARPVRRSTTAAMGRSFPIETPNARIAGTVPTSILAALARHLSSSAAATVRSFPIQTSTARIVRTVRTFRLRTRARSARRAGMVRRFIHPRSVRRNQPVATGHSSRIVRPTARTAPTVPISRSAEPVRPVPCAGTALWCFHRPLVQCNPRAVTVRR